MKTYKVTMPSVQVIIYPDVELVIKAKDEGDLLSKISDFSTKDINHVTHRVVFNTNELVNAVDESEMATSIKNGIEVDDNGELCFYSNSVEIEEVDKNTNIGMPGIHHAEYEDVILKIKKLEGQLGNLLAIANNYIRKPF